MSRFILAGLVGTLVIAAALAAAVVPTVPPRADGIAATGSLLGARQWLNTAPLRAEDIPVLLSPASLAIRAKEVLP